MKNRNYFVNIIRKIIISPNAKYLFYETWYAAENYLTLNLLNNHGSINVYQWCPDKIMAYNSGCQRNIKIKLLHFLYHYNTFRARAPTYLLPLLDTPVQSWQLAWPSLVSSHPKARETCCVACYDQLLADKVDYQLQRSKTHSRSLFGRRGQLVA